MRKHLPHVAQMHSFIQTRLSPPRWIHCLQHASCAAYPTKRHMRYNGSITSVWKPQQMSSCQVGSLPSMTASAPLTPGSSCDPLDPFRPLLLRSTPDLRCLKCSVTLALMFAATPYSTSCRYSCTRYCCHCCQNVLRMYSLN